MLEQKLGPDRRITVLRANGLERGVGLVPPPERRGLVLIDPSYEVKDEHSEVVEALQKMHRRFATGTYAIWYPVLERRWVERFERGIRGLQIESLDVYELCVAPDGRRNGLMGSGMLVVNPPWKVRDELEIALPWLAEELRVEGTGSYRTGQ